VVARRQREPLLLWRGLSDCEVRLGDNERERRIYRKRDGHRTWADGNDEGREEVTWGEGKRRGRRETEPGDSYWWKVCTKIRSPRPRGCARACSGTRSLRFCPHPARQSLAPLRFADSFTLDYLLHSEKTYPCNVSQDGWRLMCVP
jgi:hypothetical protein